MKKLIDLESYPVQPVLGRLLKDKTTKQNIVFATDAYADLGPEYSANDQITKEKVSGSQALVRIQPRVKKAAAEQQARTKKRAEVFTPSWIVNKMNNHCDQEWFGVSDVFNIENGQSRIVAPMLCGLWIGTVRLVGKGVVQQMLEFGVEKGGNFAMRMARSEPSELDYTNFMHITIPDYELGNLARQLEFVAQITEV